MASGVGSVSEPVQLFKLTGGGGGVAEAADASPVAAKAAAASNESLRIVPPFVSAARSRLILAEPLISSPQFPSARSLVRVARTVNSPLTLSEPYEKSPFPILSRCRTPPLRRARMPAIRARHGRQY